MKGRRRAAVPTGSTEHAVIARLFVLANRQMTKLGHLGLVNYLESRGGCSRERCAPSCLEMQSTLDAAMDVLDAPEAGAADLCHACGHAGSDHRAGAGCIEATLSSDGETWLGCPCDVEAIPPEDGAAPSASSEPALSAAKGQAQQAEMWESEVAG